MSSLVNNQIDDHDPVLVAPENKPEALSKDALFSTSLAVMTMTTSQMLESFEVPESHPHENIGAGDALTTSMMLERQEKRTEENQPKMESRTQSLGSEQLDPQKKEYAGKDAIFAAAGLTAQVQSKAQDSVIQHMEQTLKIMDERLKALQKMEEFVQELQKDLDAFQSDPSDENFQKLMTLLKNHFPEGTSERKIIDQLMGDEGTAHHHQNEWDDHHHWYQAGWRWFHESYKHAMGDFASGEAADKLATIEQDVFGSEPQLYSLFKLNGKEAFTDLIQSVMNQMAMLRVLIALLSGNGKEAVFKVEALLMTLQEAAAKNATKKGEQHTKMGDINIKIQQDNYNKAIDNLKKIAKSEHHSHGIFGWIADAFKAIVQVFIHVFTEGPKAFAKQLLHIGEDILGIRGLVTFIQDMIKGESFTAALKDGMEKQVGGLSQDLLEGTDLGDDMKQLSQLIVNTVAIVAEAVFAAVAEIFAGLEAIGGGSKIQDFISGDLKDSMKANGMDILQNPAFQAISDVAMLAIAAAAACTGQEWLAVIMVMLVCMNDITTSNGDTLMQAATKGLAKELGVPKAVADAIVIALVIAVTCGSGAGAAAEEGTSMAVGEAASEAASETAQAVAKEVVSTVASQVVGETVGEAVGEAATEVASSTTSEVAANVTSQVASTATSEASSSADSAASKLKEALRKTVDALKPGQRALVGGMMGTSTNFAADFAKAVAKGNKDLQRDLEIIIQVLEMVIMMVGGFRMAAPDGPSALVRKIPELANWMEENSSYLTKLASNLRTGGGTAQMFASAGINGNNMLIGHLQNLLSQVRGNIAIMTFAEDMNKQATKRDSDEMKKIMQGTQQFVKDFDSIADASRSIADAIV